MDLKKRSKRKIEFSMSSMTDIVFLLLIFFMLTSTLIAPNALKLLLPKSTANTTKPSKRITIELKQGLNCIVDGQQISIAELERRLSRTDEDTGIILHPDKEATAEDVVTILDLGRRLEKKMVIIASNEN